MIENNHNIFISTFIFMISFILISVYGCGSSYELKLEDNPQDQDLTGTGVKVVDISPSFYDNVLKELFETGTIKANTKEIFYFNFNSSHVANSDTLANSSLVCSSTGIDTTTNSFSSNDIDYFLRQLRMKIDSFGLKDSFNIAITKNKPTNNKYSTIYITKSYTDTYCSTYSNELNGIAILDRANLKQDDSAFIFYKSDDKDLDTLVDPSIDIIFTMLGIKRTDTSKYNYSDINPSLGNANINSMARVLWEVNMSEEFDLSLFKEDLDRIMIADLEVPDGFKDIMQAYTTAVDSSANKSSVLKNLASLLKNALNRDDSSGGGLSSFLSKIKNKEQSSLPDFDVYLELDGINYLADLIYVYNNQITYIKDQNYDLDTSSKLKSMLMIGFLQRYSKIKTSE